MRLIDLHAHTTASDGTLSPQDLVRLAMVRGVSVLAVTDHDTVAGIPAAMTEGANAGLEIVPGVEVTAYEGDLEVHILGHFVDVNDRALGEFLASSRDDRITRIHRIVDRLWAAGLPLDADEILSQVQAPDSSVGRPHVAQAMMRRGYVGSVQEAFNRYLTAGKPGYVERLRIPGAEAISAIKRAGGVPSLAHPGVYGRDDVIPRLVDQGLMGLEVHHPDHDAEAIFRYERMRLRYGLLATCGSDYHGLPGLRLAELGRPSLPEAEFEAITAAAVKSRVSR